MTSGGDAAAPPPHYQRSGSSSFRPNSSKREFDPYKAQAIQRAKAAQDGEERPWSTLDGPFYSIDVECVATGFGHGHYQRLPGRIAMVDGEGITVLDEVVRHPPDSADRTIVSYLTPLTGLTKEGCESPTNKSIDEISELVKAGLPKDAILVGQSIDHDIDWLNLVKGTDFRDYVDLASIFRQRVPRILKSAANAIRNEKEGGEGASAPGGDQDVAAAATVTVTSPADATKNTKPSSSSAAVCAGLQDNEQDADDATVGFRTKYRIFSLRHCCVNLLDVDMQKSHHDPADDARYSILLFQRYKGAAVPLLRAVRDSLHRAPITPSFSADMPVVDGVCMSKKAYQRKHAARFIWRWWTKATLSTATTGRLGGGDSYTDIDAAAAAEPNK